MITCDSILGDFETNGGAWLDDAASDDVAELTVALRSGRCVDTGRRSMLAKESTRSDFFFADVHTGICLIRSASSSKNLQRARISAFSGFVAFCDVANFKASMQSSVACIARDSASSLVAAVLIRASML